MPASSSRLDRRSDPVFDRSRTPDVVLRTKPIWIAFFFALTGASAIALSLLTYSSGFVDPRLPLIAVQLVVFGIAIIRSRVVVVDGLFWRRGLRRYR